MQANTVDQQLILLLKQCFNDSLVNFPLKSSHLSKPNQSIVLKILRMIIDDLNVDNGNNNLNNHNNTPAARQRMHSDQINTNNFNENYHMLQQLTELSKEYLNDSYHYQLQHPKERMNLDDVDFFQLIFYPESNVQSFRIALMMLCQLKKIRINKKIYFEQIHSHAIELREFRKKFDERKEYLNELQLKYSKMIENKNNLAKKLNDKKRLVKNINASNVDKLIKLQKLFDQ